MVLTFEVEVIVVFFFFLIFSLKTFYRACADLGSHLRLVRAIRSDDNNVNACQRCIFKQFYFQENFDLEILKVTFNCKQYTLENSWRTSYSMIFLVEYTMKLYFIAEQTNQSPRVLLKPNFEFYSVLLYAKIIVKGASFKAVRLHGARERLLVFQIVMILIHILRPASIFISGVVSALKFINFIFFFYWRVNSLYRSCNLFFILEIARKL